MMPTAPPPADAKAPPPKRRASQAATKVIGQVAKASFAIEPPSDPDNEKFVCVCRSEDINE